jgi:hypothetical protein
MGREIKRVPLDFEWPMDKVWQGYLSPDWPARHKCSACDGDGYSTEAKLYHQKWYGYAEFDPRETGSLPFSYANPIIAARALRNIGPDTETDLVINELRGALRLREALRLAEHFNRGRCHHLSQDDVDALAEAGRLWDFTRRPRTQEQAAALAATGDYWMKEPNGYRPTASEVNLWSLQGFGHDAVNQWVCASAHCERLGVPATCPRCDGEGEIWDSPEAKAEADAWEATQPPEGPGYQLWETVTEGSPISPVFEAPEGLAAWLVENDDTITRGRSYDDWLVFITGPGWAPSMAGPSGEVVSGVEAMVSASREKQS